MTTDKEKELLTIMISIYEKGHQQDLSELKEYAFKRIDCCPRKEEKTFCSSCTIHCYQKKYYIIRTVLLIYTYPSLILQIP